MINYNKINVRGVDFADVDINEALEIALDLIENPEEEGRTAIIHTPNSEIVQMCIENEENYGLINGADLIIPDGVGVILASKIFHRPLKKGKVAGIELCEKMLAAAAERGYGVFFYGSKPKAEGSELSVAALAAERMQTKYPGLRVVGTMDGYNKDDNVVTECIGQSGADILLVCLGAPKQEKWMAAHRTSLGTVKIMGGFGGSLDIFAGTSKRAPKIFVKLGLEWFYRLCKEPFRIVRMMALPRFLFGTLFAKNR